MVGRLGFVRPSEVDEATAPPPAVEPNYGKGRLGLIPGARGEPAQPAPQAIAPTAQAAPAPQAPPTPPPLPIARHPGPLAGAPDPRHAPLPPVAQHRTVDPQRPQAPAPQPAESPKRKKRKNRVRRKRVKRKGTFRLPAMTLDTLKAYSMLTRQTQCGLVASAINQHLDHARNDLSPTDRQILQDLVHQVCEQPDFDLPDPDPTGAQAPGDQPQMQAGPWDALVKALKQLPAPQEAAP